MADQFQCRRCGRMAPPETAQRRSVLGGPCGAKHYCEESLCEACARASDRTGRLGLLAGFVGLALTGLAMLLLTRFWR